MTTQTGRQRVSDLERLALAAFVDPLTGLRNRRGLDRDLEQSLGLARRGGRPVTVVVGDLDGLKAINDRDGHSAGDLALRALGAALESARRAGDTAYRIGGDEFLLLLADTDATQAEAVVARVKATSPSFSSGSATFPADGQDGTVLMEVADQRLYSGRRQTRKPSRSESGRRGGTGRSGAGIGAMSVAALTVMALLGGVGVGFAAENVMGAGDGAARSVNSPVTPIGVPRPSGELSDMVAAADPATEAGGAAPVSEASTSTIADQGEVAATIESTPLDDVAGLITLPLPDPITVVEVVEETVADEHDEAQTKEEPQKAPKARSAGDQPGGRQAKSQ